MLEIALVIVGILVAIVLGFPAAVREWRKWLDKRNGKLSPEESEHGLPPPKPKPKPTDKFQLENLPTPHSSDLIGRTSEKALLTREWKNRDKRNILALIAEGGTGKSFLVSRWLAELKDKKPAPYAGAQRIFTWSFYSQGSKGQVTSSEGFFFDLLRSFGENPEDHDSLGRADKALELVCRQTMILVLDGVEPLQNPPGHTDAGRFHDRTIGDFVNRLARQPWPGLVIVTSRQRLAELAADEGQAVRHEDVEALEPEDGAALLACLGVTGPAEEMQKASAEMGGHAFGLVLLGRYLADVTGDGDIFKRDQVKLLYTHVKGAEKAKAMLQAYADRFGAASAETAMLHLLGLFDRPVPKAALEKLVDKPVIAGLTDPFIGADAPPLAIVLKHLEELHLITRPNAEPDVEIVDGHPLVREHFGAALEEKSPEAWREAHARLFDYFRAIPEMDQPNSEAGLLPLYQSLHHGVAAGRAQEALDEVYYRRIDRGGKGYGVHQLGLFSTELAALAAFFPGGWQTPVQEVTRHDQTYLLNTTSFCLQALGRLKEAQTPFELQMALCIELKDHKNAAANSGNLSELVLVRGELPAALQRASDAVDFIDKTEEKFFQVAYRALLAHVLAIQGKMQKAQTLFEEAEQRQKQERPDLPYLYSLQGYVYISFLLRAAAPSDLPGLTERVQVTLKDVTHLLSIALDSLNLARIAARAGDNAAAAQFDDAIAALQKAGARHYIPLGYLARAGFRRAHGDLEGAWEDLVQTRHIAEPAGMRLYLCDALFEEAWLHHLDGKTNEARAAFDQAEAEVNAMGYHWQDDELEKLRQALD